MPQFNETNWSFILIMFISMFSLFFIKLHMDSYVYTKMNTASYISSFCPLI